MYRYRVFWLSIISVCFWGTSSVCISQWHRFQNNSTELYYQTDYKNWLFQPPAYTICSNYVDVILAKELVLTFWNISESDDKYDYYFDFVTLVATTNYSNFYRYEKYINDTTLIENNTLLNIMIMVST